jgi:hypothetical protein
VVEKRVLRRTFALKTKEVAGGWKKNYLMRSILICSLPDIIRAV